MLGKICWGIFLLKTASLCITILRRNAHEYLVFKETIRSCWQDIFARTNLILLANREWRVRKFNSYSKNENYSSKSWNLTRYNVLYLWMLLDPNFTYFILLFHFKSVKMLNYYHMLGYLKYFLGAQTENNQRSIRYEIIFR